MEAWLLILLAVGLVVVTRSVLRFVNDEVMNADAFVHYIIARSIRESGHRLPDRSPQSLLPGRFSYPCLLHYLLSFVDPERYRTINRHFSAAMDLLFAGVIVSLAPLGVLTYPEVVVAMAVFVATPQYIHPEHPHGIGLSARKPGHVFFAVATLATTLWLTGGGPSFLVVAIAAGGAVALTSRFSVQALVAVSAAYALLVSPLALVPLAGGLLFAVLLSKGFYATVLADHVRYSYDYAVRKQYVYLYDGLKSVDTVRRIVTADEPMDVLKALYDSVLLRSVLDHPFVFAVGLAYLLRWLGGATVAYPVAFDVWVGTGVVVAVLTSLYHLRFLGHAERYLEHATLPALVVVARSYTELGALYRVGVWTVVAGGVAVMAAYLYAHNSKYKADEARDFAEVVSFLNGRDTERVLVQPRVKGAEIAWKTGHVVSDFTGNAKESRRVIAEWDRLFPEREGWITDDVEWLARQYEPDWVVFDLTRPDPVSLAPPLDEAPTVGTDAYELYPFEAVRRSASD